ncbi:MAG TPA: RIP metalloprotease RseP [Myxococcota bacterium]|nr:RIP metalloprotease RseP [Myxococcota bacterium]MDP7073349.1 RIP metalloprotease RseP [Myxococcota bacterium]HJO25576.1 RIP metalloprotease RseP [Myxococcota bacterium]
MTTLFAVALLLSVLVFVHELGHFAAAKACGVRVLKFSVGFGSPIGFGPYRLSWVRGHTEYVLAWIPFGGFVKMLGENPDEENSPEAEANREETLGAKPLWQKLLIIFAGPVMNLVLPVFVFVGLQWAGLPRADAVIGLVEAESPAASAGLEPGDRILAVDGVPVRWWSEVSDAVAEAPGDELALEVERDGSKQSVSLPVVSRSQFDLFGEMEASGWAGLSHPRPAALVALFGVDVPARAAGIESGDLVTSVDGHAVDDWYALEAGYAAASAPVVLGITRGEGGDSLELEVPALGSLESLGLVYAGAPVVRVSEDSPAAAAGLAAGDVVIGYDGRSVSTFESLARAVASSGGASKSVRFLRDGEVHEVRIAAEPSEIESDVAGPRYRLGIAGGNTLLRGEVETDRERNPLVAFPRAVEMTVDITRVFMIGLSKLVTGDVSRKHLAGPIGIAQMAGDALRQSWADYLRLMVLISINLGILNLLPIPILDGGQASLFVVEALNRKPLSLRTKLAVQQVGLTVVILLMGLAFWNDLERLWAKASDWLPQGF